jgi:hypothetical protein
VEYVNTCETLCDETDLQSIDAGGSEHMIPGDDDPKRAVPVVGLVTNLTYGGPVTWPRNRSSTASSADSNDKAHTRLELIDGATRPVTYLFERNSGRLRRKEE